MYLYAYSEKELQSSESRKGIAVRVPSVRCILYEKTPLHKEEALSVLVEDILELNMSIVYSHNLVFH